MSARTSSNILMPTASTERSSLLFDIEFVKEQIPWDAFLDNGGGAFVYNVSLEKFEQLNGYIEHNGSKIRVIYNAERQVLYIKRPTDVHETPGQVITGFYWAAYNTEIDGPPGGSPLLATGCARTSLLHGTADPDGTWRTSKRHSPNMVLETRCMNLEENFSEWFHSLRDYITQTTDVNVVLGVILLRQPNDRPGRREMILVKYTRSSYQQHPQVLMPTDLISFGNREVCKNTVNAVEAAVGEGNPDGLTLLNGTVNTLRGWAQGDPACSAANIYPYVIEVAGSDLLMVDNLGQQFWLPDGINPVIPLNGAIIPPQVTPRIAAAIQAGNNAMQAARADGANVTVARRAFWNAYMQLLPSFYIDLFYLQQQVIQVGL